MIEVTSEHLDYYSKREKYIEVDNTKLDLFNKHSAKWDYYHQPINLKPGQLFLYEKEEGSHESNKVSYPQLGIYLNYYMLYMAVEVEFIPYRRTWENNISYEYTYNDKKYDNMYSELSARIEHFICWNDSLFIYGAWDKLPDFRTLRKAYQNTWTFYKTISDKRDISIVNILNGNK